MASTVKSQGEGSAAAWEGLGAATPRVSVVIDFGLSLPARRDSAEGLSPETRADEPAQEAFNRQLPMQWHDCPQLARRLHASGI
jgi:hypothetical protein